MCDASTAASANQGNGLRKWQDKGVAVNENNLIYSCNDFVVFLDASHDVDWLTDDSYDPTLNKLKEDKRWGKITSQVTALQAIPMAHLGNEHQLGFRRQVAKAMERALDGDFENALDGLQLASDYIEKRNKEASRKWFLEASSVTAFTIIIIPSLWFWTFFGRIFDEANTTVFERLMLAVCGGAIGSWLSVLSRIAKLPIEPAAGRYLHYLEGAGRVLAGAVAGPVILFAIKLGIFLPELNDSGAEGAVVVGIVSGLSERLLPSLASKIEPAEAKES